VSRYTISMIKSFRHKGLEIFFETGNKKGIQPEHSDKLERILDVLNASITPLDMNLPGFKLHELTGNERDTCSVKVNGNWRVTFKFENGDAIILDYRDYH